MLIIINFDYNYTIELAKAYIIHCLHQFTDEHLENLETCTQTGMQPGQFLTKLHI